MTFTRSHFISLGFVVLRGVLVCRYFGQFTYLGALYGLSECSALVLTVGGLMRGKVDTRVAGMLLPFLYVLPLAFQPTSEPTRCAPLLTIACLCQLILRARMGRRLSVGVPVFLKLLTLWPYSVIRHPLALVEFTQACCFVLTFPTAWNMVAACFVLPGIAGSALIEEHFLLTVSTYRDYSRFVRWRFIPGVW